MIGVRRHERFIENQRGLLESTIEVAVGPLVSGLAHRQMTVVHVGEVLLRPLHFFYVRSRRRPVRGWRTWCPHVAIRARVGSARPERVERIHVKRQELPMNLDLLDGFSGDELAVGGHREHRFAVSAAPGISSAVRIARTPGTANAAVRSSRRTRAWGMRLSRSLAKSIPSTR